MPKLERLSLAYLYYILFVIVWGAYVRATGSGAGCGDHWPLCNGKVIPRPEQIETLIEYIHRLTSGLTMPFALYLTWRVRKAAAPKAAERWAWISIFFLVMEALLGAGLVKFELVAGNASLARAWVMALHLINTLMLLTGILMIWWWVRAPRIGLQENKHPQTIPPIQKTAAGMMMLMFISGAIAALGNTLFPATSLQEGFTQDFSTQAHIFLRLRILHPFFAIGTAAILGWISLKELYAGGSRPAKSLAILTGIQLTAGVLNLVLLAPVAMQLLHLLIADLLWLALVWVIQSQRYNLETAEVLP